MAANTQPTGWSRRRRPRAPTRSSRFASIPPSSARPGRRSAHTEPRSGRASSDGEERSRAMPQLAGYRDEGMFGSIETVGAAGVFGQVMGLVAVTLAFFTLGAYLGREIAEGVSIVCFIGGFICIIGLRAARRSEALSITLLFAAGLLLGLGLGGVLNRYVEAEPDAVWQA